MEDMLPQLPLYKGHFETLSRTSYGADTCFTCKEWTTLSCNNLSIAEEVPWYVCMRRGTNQPPPPPGKMEINNIPLLTQTTEKVVGSNMARWLSTNCAPMYVCVRVHIREQIHIAHACTRKCVCSVSLV